MGLQSVLKNIHKDSLLKFLASRRLKSDYESSGQGDFYFLEAKMADNTIKASELNDFFLEALSFGYYKDVYIYKIDEVSPLNTYEEILHAINKDYPYINSLNYNNIMNTDFQHNDNRKAKIAAIMEKKENSRIIYIRFLFAQQIQVKTENGNIDSIMFIPIDVDFKNKLIYSKIYERSYVVDYDNYFCMDVCIKKVINYLNINDRIVYENHKSILYSLCTDLINKSYQKAAHIENEKFNKMIHDVTDKIYGEITIDNVEDKRNQDAIYNLEESIKLLIKNLYIYDFYSESLNSFDEGKITKVRFSNRRNVNASVKGVNSKTEIFTSDVFISLREAMEKTKEIRELMVVWPRESNELRVNYDASNINYLLIKFYTKLEEGDLSYALEKFKEFE